MRAPTSRASYKRSSTNYGGEPKTSRITFYVDYGTAKNKDEAKADAWARLQLQEGTNAPLKYVVSSIIPNRGQGGWTVCFKKRPIIIERENLETFIANQGRMHKAAADKADEMTEAGIPIKAARYMEEAATREAVVNELAKYLSISYAEIEKIWTEATQ